MSRSLKTRLGRLAYEDSGDGPPVLFWHSLFATRHMWRAQADDLARDYRVILVDGPAHGDSAPPPRPFSLEDCAFAAAEILDACGIERAVWVGLSWGGMVALRAALYLPERVTGLGLFDTSGEPEPLPVRLRNQAMLAFYRRFGFVDLLAEKIRGLMLGASTLRRDPRAGDDILEHVARADREGMVRAIEAVVMERRSVLEDLSRATQPALVAVGTEDLATPPPFAERLAAALPHARLERIPESGHLSALEAPETVTRLVRELLTRCASS